MIHITDDRCQQCQDEMLPGYQACIGDKPSHALLVECYKKYPCDEQCDMTECYNCNTARDVCKNGCRNESREADDACLRDLCAPVGFRMLTFHTKQCSLMFY